jgi:hypothetical protein
MSEDIRNFSPAHVRALEEAERFIASNDDWEIHRPNHCLIIVRPVDSTETVSITWTWEQGPTWVFADDDEPWAENASLTECVSLAFESARLVSEQAIERAERFNRINV